MRVTVWNEFRHEKQNPAVAAIYPDGIHAVVAAALRRHGLEDVWTATLDQPAQGLPPDLLNSTDVLLWWGHRYHDEVSDELAAAVCERVIAGMGLVILHSGHFSKVFKQLMGTPCSVQWRADGELERMWLVATGHPIAAGVPNPIELPLEEMYGEPFEVPPPDEIIYLSWFKGGEVFRSGCCYRRGRGRIFFFRPGHETFPTYHQPAIQQVIANGVRWATPQAVETGPFPNVKVAPREPIA